MEEQRQRQEAPVTERAFSVVGLFRTPEELLAAIPKVKAALASARGGTLGRLEAYTPYPIHGLDRALGLRRSPLGGMVMVMGVLGAAAAMVLQWWTSAVDYPLVTGGKALFSWEAFVPVMFEVMVAFATFTAGLGMLFLLNRLPGFSHPMLAARAMAAITRDRYALALEADGGTEIDVRVAEATLRDAGAVTLEVVPFRELRPPASATHLGRILAGIVLACAVSGYATYWAMKLFPVLPPMAHMLDQPKPMPQRTSAFFPDGRVQRLPAAGAVARGHLPYDVATPEAADTLTNPLPRSREVLLRGQRLFDTYCVVCHGPLANGTGTLTSAYGAKPANLQSAAIRGRTDGRLYDVIVRGRNSMPSYAPDLSEDERWAVVHYVRVLQRAQNAREEDLR
jgi:mono/diheme cytochrome c family protein